MFSPDTMQTFELFSLSHISVLIVFFILLLLMLVFRQQIKDEKTGKVVGYLLLTTLIASEISYQVWSISAGVWNVQNYLPLQLCSFSTFFGIYLYWKRNNWIFYFYFYIGLIPPILALLTPDLLFEFPHYRYFKFFIHHMAIPLMAVYLLINRGYQLKVQSILYGLLLLNIMIVPIFLINKWTGANYFFLMGAPKGDTALSWFGTGIQYYVGLEIAAVLIFLISYVLSKGMTGVEKVYYSLSKKKAS